MTGRIIRKIRRATDLTQEQLAEAVGISQTYVSAIEVGRCSVDGELAARFALALNVPPEVLLADRASVCLSTNTTPHALVHIPEPSDARFARLRQATGRRV